MLWLPNAGWPTEWRYAQYGEEDKMKMVRRQFLHLAGAATALFAYVVRASTSALDPARVGSPATSNRSLMANDRAIEGPRVMPARALASAASAALRAICE